MKSVLYYITESSNIIGDNCRKIYLVNLLQIVSEILVIVEPLIYSKMVLNLIVKDINAFKSYFIFFVGFTIFKIVYTYCTEWVKIHIFKITNIYLKENVFKKYLRFYFHDERKNDGMLLNIFISDSLTPVNYISFVFSYLLELFSLTLMSIFLATRSIYLLYIFIFLPVIFLIQIGYGKKLRKLNIQLMNLNDKYLEHLKSLITNIYSVIISKFQNDITSNFAAVMHQVKKKLINVHITELKSNTISKIISGINNLLLYLICSILIFKEQISIETFLFAIFYLQKIMGSLMYLSSIITKSQQYHVSLDRLINIIHKSEEIFIRESKKETIININNLSLENISLEINEKHIFKKINLQINRNDHLILLGPNGTGKTSLLNILGLYYKHNEGNFLINGIDSKDINSFDTLDKISYASQNPKIFKASIKDNILCGNKNIIDAELVQICKDINLYDDIWLMPDGIDTIIGENFEISGGQQKKIQLARCICKDASLYLLDEPLSSMDSAFCDNFNFVLDKYFMHKTVVISSHDLRNLDFFNKIVEFKNGNILVKDLDIA